MATKQLPAKTYKGKYKGPDKFKGDEKKIAAWKAAKRKAGSTTASPDAAVVAPTAPISAQAPVSSPTGSLISRETWQSDQARLQSAADDAEAAETLNETESAADSEYTSTINETTKAAAQRKLELQKNREELRRRKADDFKGLNTNLAYRGASRSSAAARGTKEIATAHSTAETGLNNAETAVNNEVNDITTQATNNRESIKARVAKRRQTLAQRAAAQGVYSVGSAAEDTGVDAPTIDNTPEPVAPAPAPAAPGKKKKSAAARAEAAKRRISKKKKGKK